MKIGVLTSSRADFGIYTPLLEVIADDPDFELEIIAFGTHNSERHGATIEEIEARNYGTIRSIKHYIGDTDVYETAKSYADVVGHFTTFWHKNTYDLVLCLGDRYEMNAAVQAGIPFNIRFGHFHGGEQTLGAIDNIYRHQITHASEFHFTSTEAYKKRVQELIDTNKNKVFNVGSLSLAHIDEQPIVDRTDLLEKFDLPDEPYILATFHPETTVPGANEANCTEMIKAFEAIPVTHHLIVTMPNADTNGSIYREALIQYKKRNPKAISLVESFGKDYYFSALKHAEFVMGNSSSAIIEAASFGQFVINIGKRQEGRIQSKNTFNCEFNHTDIIILINKLLKTNHKYTGENVYVKDDTLNQTVNILRKIAHGGF